MIGPARRKDHHASDRRHAGGRADAGAASGAIKDKRCPPISIIPDVTITIMAREQQALYNCGPGECARVRWRWCCRPKFSMR